MLVSPQVLNQAITAAKISGITQHIYRLESGTCVIMPPGYTLPDVKITLVGTVDRDGNFTATDSESISERDKGSA